MYQRAFPSNLWERRRDRPPRTPGYLYPKLLIFLFFCSRHLPIIVNILTLKPCASDDSQEILKVIIFMQAVNLEVKCKGQDPAFLPCAYRKSLIAQGLYNTFHKI